MFTTEKTAMEPLPWSSYTHKALQYCTIFPKFSKLNILDFTQLKKGKEILYAPFGA